jgi:serine/threonine-protein kinase HipA
MTGSVGGIQALSVAFPISMEWKKQPRWPAFLLDILPQGHARVKLAQVLPVNPDTDACELPLLLRAGGSPIGNLRVREAWQREQERVINVRHPGLTMDDALPRLKCSRYLFVASPDLFPTDLDRWGLTWGLSAWRHETS